MPNVTTCLLGNIADTAIAAVWNWFCSQSNLIVTDHISWQSNAIGRVRLSICFHSRFWTNWSLTLISSACVSLWVKTICAWDQGWIYSKRGPCSEKNGGAPNIWIPRNSPPPDCLHPTLSGQTRTVVIIGILLKTRAAVHTTIAAAADWQFEAKNVFVLLWGPLFVGPLFGRTCWTCLNPPLPGIDSQGRSC